MRAAPIFAWLVDVGLLLAVSVVRADSTTTIPGSSQQIVAIEVHDRGYCLRANPSCLRDPWWLQWNELQSQDLVQFQFTNGALTLESRYVEAVHLLSIWEEGQALLQDGSDFGVVIESGVFDREPTAIASYSTAPRRIFVNPRYAEAATWMLAAVLSHELRHISDAKSRSFQAHLPDQCFAREARAYQTQVRFIHWLTHELVEQRLPVRELSGQASPDVWALGDSLIRISGARDVDALVRNDYAESCTQSPSGRGTVPPRSTPPRGFLW